MKLYKYNVTRRYVGEGDHPYKVSDPDAAADFLKKRNVHRQPEEHFYVLTLDTRNNVTGYQEISKGLLGRTSVHTREVFRASIIEGAAKIIVAHNHPSGDASPSRQDNIITENLCKSGEILGIQVADHLIVAETLGEFTYHSMRSGGTLSCFTSQNYGRQPMGSCKLATKVKQLYSLQMEDATSLSTKKVLGSL